MINKIVLSKVSFSNEYYGYQSSRLKFEISESWTLYSLVDMIRRLSVNSKGFANVSEN